MRFSGDRRADSCSLQRPGCIRRTARPMKTEDRRVCPSCGNEFSGAMEFCPICMLRGVLDEKEESSSGSDRAETIPTRVPHRFEHYELMSDEDGSPVESGRGAMGVTYKAFDVNLRYPVTLKSSTNEFSETNRLGFVSCARRVRRPASVTRMLPRSSIWAEALRVTSTQWSL